MKHLTPKEIVAELDKYIVGQAAAKKAVSVAIRNRWRVQQLPADIRNDVTPKNIIMVGPTGVGKTEIARRLAALTGSPFIKVEATKYTEVGYQGRDVESMIRDLVDASIGLVRAEYTEKVREQADAAVEERILDCLLPVGDYGQAALQDEDAQARRQRTRDHLRTQLRAGQLETATVELSVEDRPTAAGMFGQLGLEMDPSMQSMFERMIPSRRDLRRLSVHDARRILLDQEAEKLFDKSKVTAEALERAETQGIIFLDEVDKICGPEAKNGPDVSRSGVQRDLLPIVEGCTVVTKHGVIRTDHILFIAAGAFHTASVSDLMPELQGRFPIRVELHDLKEEDFVRILTEPQNNLIKQHVFLLATEGLKVDFTEDAITAVAEIAYGVNRKQQNIGARRLHTIMERVFESISFEAPDLKDRTVRVSGKYVRERLEKANKDDDVRKILL
jgi:ATP-dependent HslUV protease ATP-binding subunit HslU